MAEYTNYTEQYITSSIEKTYEELHKQVENFRRSYCFLLDNETEGPFYIRNKTYFPIHNSQIFEKEIFIYVDPELGSDTYSGTHPNFPLKTLGQALTLVNSASVATVLLKPTDSRGRKHIYVIDKNYVLKNVFCVIQNLDLWVYDESKIENVKSLPSAVNPNFKDIPFIYFNYYQEYNSGAEAWECKLHNLILYNSTISFRGVILTNNTSTIAENTAYHKSYLSPSYSSFIGWDSAGIRAINFYNAGIYLKKQATILNGYNQAYINFVNSNMWLDRTELVLEDGSPDNPDIHNRRIINPESHAPVVISFQGGFSLNLNGYKTIILNDDEESYKNIIENYLIDKNNVPCLSNKYRNII